jgi:hypothetical protein
MATPGLAICVKKIAWQFAFQKKKLGNLHKKSVHMFKDLSYPEYLIYLDVGSFFLTCIRLFRCSSYRLRARLIMQIICAVRILFVMKSDL